MSAARFEFWIDRGGTFTDCIGLSPDGRLHVTKVLSSDTAPLEGIREILARAGAWEDGPLPPCTVKLGTTSKAVDNLDTLFRTAKQAGLLG